MLTESKHSKRESSMRNYNEHMKHSTRTIEILKLNVKLSCSHRMLTIRSWLLSIDKSPRSERLCRFKFKTCELKTPLSRLKQHSYNRIQR